MTWLLLGIFGWLAALSLPYWLAMAFILGALVFEHRLCRTGDLTRINVAFFNMNALVGLFLVIGVAASIVLGPSHRVWAIDGKFLGHPVSASGSLP
jgi:4-hydroxybenzoate polyprenyltransferase